MSHLAAIFCKLISFTEHLRKDWDAPIYVFFKPIPTIEYVHGRKAHVFECAASSCYCKNRSIRQFLDKGDARSTTNMRWHAKVCWGKEAVTAADNTRDIKTAREALANHKSIDGSITVLFQWAEEGKITYSHPQHTKIEAQYVLSCQSWEVHKMNIVSLERYLKWMLSVPSSNIGSQRVSGHSRLWTTVGSTPSLLCHGRDVTWHGLSHHQDTEWKVPGFWILSPKRT